MSANLWEEFFRLRDEYRERAGKGMVVIKGKDLPTECNRQGMMRWYLHPSLKDRAINSLIFHTEDIPPLSRSGGLQRPGGEVIYVWQGKGHSIISGRRFDWAAGDVMNLPLLVEGVQVQHFNDDPEEVARLVCAEVNTVDMMGVDRGPGFEQLENSPHYEG